MPYTLVGGGTASTGGHCTLREGMWGHHTYKDSLGKACLQRKPVGAVCDA